MVDQAGLELTPACLALSMERALTERSNISSRITDKLLFWELNWKQAYYFPIKTQQLKNESIPNTGIIGMVYHIYQIVR